MHKLTARDSTTRIHTTISSSTTSSTTTKP